jgi:hypothetical protein
MAPEVSPLAAGGEIVNGHVLSVDKVADNQFDYVVGVCECSGNALHCQFRAKYGVGITRTVDVRSEGDFLLASPFVYYSLEGPREIDMDKRSCDTPLRLTAVRQAVVLFATLGQRLPTASFVAPYVGSLLKGELGDRAKKLLRGKGDAVCEADPKKLMPFAMATKSVLAFWNEHVVPVVAKKRSFMHRVRVGTCTGLRATADMTSTRLDAAHSELTQSYLECAIGNVRSVPIHRDAPNCVRVFSKKVDERLDRLSRAASTFRLHTQSYIAWPELAWQVKGLLIETLNELVASGLAIRTAGGVARAGDAHLCGALTFADAQNGSVPPTPHDAESSWITMRSGDNKVTTAPEWRKYPLNSTFYAVNSVRVHFEQDRMVYNLLVRAVPLGEERAPMEAALKPAELYAVLFGSKEKSAPTFRTDKLDVVCCGASERQVAEAVQQAREYWGVSVARLWWGATAVQTDFALDDALQTHTNARISTFKHVVQCTAAPCPLLAKRKREALVENTWCELADGTLARVTAELTKRGDVVCAQGKRRYAVYAHSSKPYGDDVLPLRALPLHRTHVLPSGFLRGNVCVWDDPARRPTRLSAEEALRLTGKPLVVRE